ncbi:potentail helicase mov-10 [Ophiostoma piceae UAMH 11346]|uniref:Potentail helicase mov-10 n=1 Tax=Ophiostoma piceae (strain UAMH 11346) TaxID=1262450 RepID=S3C2M8_OPHP1|nr:potentail helicase mov-10 [Ophiostoma piceae UAMH 11346]
MAGHSISEEYSALDVMNILGPHDDDAPWGQLQSCLSPRRQLAVRSCGWDKAVLQTTGFPVPKAAGNITTSIKAFTTTNPALASQSIVYDTGASDHIYNTTTAFHNLQLYSSPSKHVATGAGPMLLKGIGDINLVVKHQDQTYTIRLQNVYFSPSFPCNLISAGKLAQTGITLDMAQLKLVENGMPIANITMTNDIFFLRAPPPSASLSDGGTGLGQPAGRFRDNCCPSGVSSGFLVHTRDQAILLEEDACRHAKWHRQLCELSAVSQRVWEKSAEELPGITAGDMSGQTPELALLKDSFSGVNYFTYAETCGLSRESVVVEKWARSRGLTLSAPRALPIFIHCLDSESSVTESMSRVNHAQNAHAISIIKEVISSGLQESNITMITPYRSNLACLKESLTTNGLSSIPVHTTDSFQGQEAPVVVVILCTDRNPGPLFTASQNWLCVATTRHSAALIIVGDIETVPTDTTGKDTCVGAMFRYLK